MRKISKTIGLFLIIVFFSLCTGCTNKYTTYSNGVDITVSTSLQEYFIQTTLPVLHFDMQDVNVMIDADGSAVFFVSNDQYKLSDAFAAHLATYMLDDICIISESAQTYDNGTARFGTDKLELDEKDEFNEEQPYAKEYQIVAATSNGTRYSYQFRTFVSGGKRYYIYRYSSNIGISLEQPLMVVKDETNTNKLLLLSLPYDTKYEVSGSILSKKSLINKDTYLAERYSKFAYPTALDSYSEEEKIVKIKDWYVKYCNGYTDDEGNFIFEYLGARFQVIFGVTDAANTMNQKGFQLIYLD